MGTRSALLDSVGAFATLAATPEVGAAWSHPSALDTYEVGDVAGHVLSSTLAIERFLDREPPTVAPLPPATYYSYMPSAREAPDAHAAIRDRATALAARGQAVIVEELLALHRRLTERLGSEPADRLVEVTGRRAMRLDDYLETRVVELVVHLDDLAASVGSATELPAEAAALTIRHLVDAARHRHGEVAIIRALTRKERVETDPFPLL
ncbi:MAG: maleylpyruvate isomerase N-terminal domain-containing protein [Acidimicrobiales bacterium]|nr:maleylpyruvate isomerase N-terminal domain-containing protein [Acidimicrobiales bacterium]